MPERGMKKIWLEMVYFYRCLKNPWTLFYVGTPSGVYLFNYLLLLWPLSQSSITHKHYTITSSYIFLMTSVGSFHYNPFSQEGTTMLKLFFITFKFLNSSWPTSRVFYDLSRIWTHDSPSCSPQADVLPNELSRFG